tara:strand:- start:654 stop:1688 length:1035 start_codon:yes stop_codon:yes gene_type:complete
MIDYSSIRSVHLEISTRCNASCPLCPRNLAGYDTDLGYPVHDMRLEEAQKIFSPQFLKQLDKILINGNFGDFVTAKDGLKIIQYFVEQNPKIEIEISTNASAKPNMWSELGKIPNVFVGFDIDGLKDTHSLYRRYTDWDLIISNAKKFIAAGGRAKWRMIQFYHNKHQVAECKLMSEELGFVEFDMVYDGRDAGPVYDRDGKYAYTLGENKLENPGNYPPKAETWAEWTAVGAQPSVRKKQYLEIKPKDSVDCYAKKNDEIYISATGQVYPCCWLGFYPNTPFKHAWQSDTFQIAEAINSNNNALEIGVENAINWFKTIENGWNLDSYAKGRLFICDQVCGKNN